MGEEDGPVFTRPMPKGVVDNYSNGPGRLRKRRLEVIMSDREWAWWQEQRHGILVMARAYVDELARRHPGVFGPEPQKEPGKGRDHVREAYERGEPCPDCGFASCGRGDLCPPAGYEMVPRRTKKGVARTVLLLERRPVRGSVLAFAALMEKTLRRNDYKGGWGTMSVRWLRGRLHKEVAELDLAIRGLSRGVKPQDVAREAADVANFCMMIADRCGGMDGQRLYIEPVETAAAGERRE